LTWNYPGWSLSCEAFYYALFPMVGYFLWKLTRRRAMLLAGAGLWCLSLAAPAAAVLIPLRGFGDIAAAGGAPSAENELWGGLISFNPLAGLPAFSAGILLARLYRSLDPESRWFGRGDWFSIPALGILILVLSQANRIPLPLVHNGLLLPVYSVLIFGLALGGPGLPRILALPPLVFLGNASYAMYILHFPIAEWVYLAGKAVGGVSFQGLSWAICYPCVVIAGASLFYVIVEDPLHRRLRRALSVRFVEAERIKIDSASPRS
jgi:peptidoglycan/LPS O-acetylase OafA/YrhL